VRAPVPPPAGDERPQRRVPMTRLRARVAERLVAAQRTAAALTTFNEINMQPVVEMRERYREAFEKEHGVKLGFMSFFVKASIEALKRFPAINASIDGQDIVYHGFYDVGVAVSSPRGLVVPVVRDADQLSMANIESRVKELSEKARTAGLAMEDISGGTFTITNGGVFGSLLSTPILNPPQSAILGMHKIEPRPMAENGQVVIRPMMYVALTYDHRLVDGREAVQFLVTIKELLEDPNRMLIDV
jgi:2-oxoglutarate dehydrogenase E2 component (dihydrolipoamide succinyltransferase)